jgi:hypothetical protein
LLRRIVIALVLLATAGSITAGVLAFTDDGNDTGGDAKEPPPLSQRPGGSRVAVVAAAGDIACDEDDEPTEDECEQGDTANLLERSELSAVLPLGDLQYEDAELSDFEDSWDKTWGRLKDITRPAPGNHEYKTSDAEGYFDYFGDAAGERGKGYYSFDLGRWHLIALNSNCDEIGGCEPGSAQEKWLRDDLAAHKARCTLAYWHHPRFSSGRHGNHGETGPFWEALHDAGADLVLSGHDHSYERFAPQTPGGEPDQARGIREFVVGTGGKSFYEFPTVEPNSEVQNNDTHGILKLTLRPAGYDWQFVPEEGASFSDGGSGRCH